MTPELIERTQRFLFASPEEMERERLTAKQQERILRLRDMYVYWLQHPELAEKAVVAQLRERYRCGLTQAYEDVRLLKVCMGNLGQVTRPWCQYIFMQRCEEGFEMARRSGDAKAFASVLSAMGKYTRLDHDELAGPDYSQIVPQRFEMTSDPAVAGFERIPDVVERSRSLFRRLKAEAEDAEVVPAKPEYSTQSTSEP